ncbi:MAG TPA: Rieske (2Fe-2S) protein [Nocardioides sp.]|nr:Rieske (2Fe-2S) protein [Nocardioides sp.]
MEPDTSRLSRRTLLGAGAGVPLTAVLLTACGEDEPTTAAPDTEPTSEDAASSEPAESEAPADESLAAVADIPVGGALVVENGPGGKPVVLAQPRDGEVVAFSAVCTHKGCTVTAEERSIVCPCHGSTYDLTGANTGGPAPSPLPKVEVTVADGQVRPA